MFCIKQINLAYDAPNYMGIQMNLQICKVAEHVIASVSGCRVAVYCNFQVQPVRLRATAKRAQCPSSADAHMDELSWKAAKPLGLLFNRVWCF